MAKTLEPFVGPRPFEPEDEKYFFGRKQVASELVSLIMAHSTVILYAQSGAGKTSLLKAKVLSALEKKQGFDVLPIARVRSQDAAGDETVEVANIYVANALRDFSDNSLPLDKRAQMTFKEYLAARPRPPLPDEEFDEDDDEEERAQAAARRPRVIIFDQFEELFTFYPERYKNRQDFFEQLRDALAQDPLMRVVFSMREDYIAELDPYVHILPDSMRIRFRMERLRKDAALQAVVGPLKRFNEEMGKSAEEGLRFEEGVADRLVDNLRTIKLHSGTEEIEFTGEFIEPVHLQIVCKAILEKMLAEGHQVITHQDLETYGNVNQALTEYFERAVAKAAGAANINEGDLRRWFDSVLITPENTRSTVLRGRTETARIPNAAIDVLAAERLIRSETRDNREWYELSHDKLIEPVRESYQQWLLTQPADDQVRLRLIRQAENWLATRPRDDSLLLGETELPVARRWANPDDAGYNEALASLVEASQSALDRVKHEREQALALERQRLAEAMAEAEREKAVHAQALLAEQKRSAKKLRALVAVLAFMVLLSLFTTGLAWQQRGSAFRASKEAERQKQIAQAQKTEADKQRDAAEKARRVAEEQTGIAEAKTQEAKEQREEAEKQEKLAQEQAAAARQAELRAAAAAKAEGIEREKAVKASKYAESQKIIAVSSTAAARAELMLAQQPNEIKSSVQYALASLRFNPESGEGQQALRHGLALLPRRLRTIDFNPVTVAFTPQGDIAVTDFWTFALYSKDGQEKFTKTVTTQDEIVSILSPDGRYGAFIGAGKADFVNLTNPKDEIKPIVYGTNPDDDLYKATFSQHGKYLAGVISEPGSPDIVRVWETGTGRLAMERKLDLKSTGPASIGDELAFLISENEEFIAIKGDANVFVYRIKDSSLVFTTPDFKEDFPSDFAFALSSDGNLLAMAGGDKETQIQLWDLTTKETLRWLAPATVKQIVFSPENSYLATLSGSTVTVWRTDDGQEVTRVGHTVEVSSVIFNQDETLLATTGADRTTRLWNVENGRELFRMGHEGEVVGVSFSDDGRYLVTGSDDVRLWDISSSGLGFDLNLEGDVVRITLSHNRKYVAVMFVKGTKDEADEDSDPTQFKNGVKIFETLTGQEISSLPLTDSKLDLSFSPDDELLFTAMPSGITTWRVSDGKAVGSEFKIKGGVESVAFSGDGRYAVVAMKTQEVELIDLLDQGKIKVLPFPLETKGASRRRVAASYNGKRVLLYDRDRRLSVWDAETNRLSNPVLSRYPVRSIMLSPDGQYFAYVDLVGRGYLYDAAQGKQATVILFSGIAFSSDGQRVALSSSGNIIRIFELPTMLPLRGFVSESSNTIMAFSSDMKYLAAGGSGLVQVIDLEGGTEATRIEYNGSSRGIVFSPGNKYLITAANERSVRFTLLQIKDLIENACYRTGGLTEVEWKKFFGAEKYQQVCAKPK